MRYALSFASFQMGVPQPGAGNGEAAMGRVEMPKKRIRTFLHDCQE
jgi:hypothetical protein